MSQLMVQYAQDPSINIVKCSTDCKCRSLEIYWPADKIKTMFVFADMESLKAFVGLLGVVIGNDHD